MDFATTVGLALAAAMGASVIQGFSGFGYAIFCMPLLTLFMPLRQADQIVYVMAGVSVWTLFIRLRRHVPWRRLPWLAAGVLLGVPLGVGLGPLLPNDAGKALLGVVVMGISLPRLVRGRPVEEARPPRPGGPELAAGVASGLLGGWVNMSGPPVAYLAHGQFPPLQARALLSAVFATTSLIKLVTITAGGLWIWPSVAAGAIVAPLSLLGTTLGDRLARRLNRAAFARVVWAVFLCLGLALFVTSVLRILRADAA